MKYCSIHGPAGETDSCPHDLGGVTCNTATTDQPNARWAAILASQKPPTTHFQDLGFIDPTSDEIQQPTARVRMGRQEISQGAFLTAFEECFGIVTHAAAAAKINPCTHYEWLKTDSQYAELFTQSTMIAKQKRKDEALRRAFVGCHEPITVAGEKVMVLKFSDRLAERFLEADFPEEFRSNLAHRLVDKDGKDRKLLDYQELDALVKAADARDKEQS